MAALVSDHAFAAIIETVPRQLIHGFGLPASVLFKVSQVTYGFQGHIFGYIVSSPYGARTIYMQLNSCAIPSSLKVELQLTAR
jgi:hypothetical protein